MRNTDGWLPPLRAGRQPAARALLSWLDDPQAPRLCRLSGSPGTGKSHLLNWLATAATSVDAPELRRPSAVLSVAGLSLDGALWRLAARLGTAVRTPSELLDELRPARRPQLLLVQDLNRAADPVRIAAELLDPLLALPHVRAVVEAATGTPEAGALRAIAGPAVLDLDEPGWTDRASFNRWYRSLAADSPFTADTVCPNPRLAELAVRVPVGADPSEGVVAAWWSGLPDELRPAIQALLAVDRPITFEEWSLLCDPDTACRAGELLPPDSATTGDTWWLPPGPLREAVLASSPGPDHAAAFRALADSLPRTADDRPDYGQVDAGLLGLMLSQAVLAGSADSLLDDALFLAHADPIAVTAAFAAKPYRGLAKVWHYAGAGLIEESNGDARAAVLRSWLLGGRSMWDIQPSFSAGWQADRVGWLSPAEPRLLAAARTQGPYAGYLLAAAADGRMRAVHLATGQASDVQALPAPAGLRSLTALPDGSVVALDSSGHPHLLAGTALPELPNLADARPTVLGPLPTVGDSDGRVHWMPDGTSEPLHTGPVTALDGMLLAGNGKPMLISGGLDGSVRVWKPGGKAIARALDRRPCPVVAVALAEWPQGLVQVAAWADGMVRIRRTREMGGFVDVRLGSPVRTVVIDAYDRVVLGLADGTLGVALGTPPPDPDRLGRFFFSTQPPSTARPPATGWTEPPLPDAVRVAARRHPGQWLSVLDPMFDANGQFPTVGVMGCWQVDHQGGIGRYIPSPDYLATPEARGWPKPQSLAEAAQHRAASGYGGDGRHLLEVLRDAELLLCIDPATGEVFVSPGARGRDAVDACTSSGLVPKHWAGTVAMTGHDLATAFPGQDLRLNHGSRVASTIQIDGLAKPAAR